MTTSRPDFAQAATSILTATSTFFDLLKPELGREVEKVGRKGVRNLFC